MVNFVIKFVIAFMAYQSSDYFAPQIVKVIIHYFLALQRATWDWRRHNSFHIVPNTTLTSCRAPIGNLLHSLLTNPLAVSCTANRNNFVVTMHKQTWQLLQILAFGSSFCTKSTNKPATNLHGVQRTFIVVTSLRNCSCYEHPCMMILKGIRLRCNESDICMRFNM